MTRLPTITKGPHRRPGADPRWLRHRRCTATSPDTASHFSPPSTGGTRQAAYDIARLL